jgi:serine/threonine protein kinase
MYRNLQKLGEGGFGYVYLGQHIVTKEEVAIKVVMPFNIANAVEANKIF